MNEPPVVSARNCPYCQGLNDVRSPQCWLCKQPLQVDNPYADLPPAAPPVVQSKAEAVKEWSVLDTLSTVLLVICMGLVVLVGIGIVQNDPGMIVPLLIVCAPAFAAAFIRTAVSSASGQKASPSKTLFWFVGSLFMTIGLIAILILAFIVAAIVTCFGSLNNFH